jgi:hypothetical protein
MVSPDDAAALKELVAAMPEFKRIGTVINALELWSTNRSIRDQVRIHGRQSGVDVLDFLDRLPAELGYETPEQLVCGYRPLGNSTDAEDKAEFEAWNKLCRRALNVARQPEHSDWPELQEPVNDLFFDLARFVGKRYRLAQFIKEARASRPG